ncbi:MAG TPA: L,D-transpeptidase [Thermomicrobiales bacterium]|nr:L,D-transpeptidase [Thermomicrobiales bacterium]
MRAFSGNRPGGAGIRRWWVQGAMSLALLMMALPLQLAGANGVPTPPVVPYFEANAAVELGLPVEMVPPDLGATSMQVYVESTAHTVGGWMLDYWRANGGDSVYGNPISEPFAAGGYYSQAFERGIFQFYPELLWTELPAMSLMPLGQTALDARAGAFRLDGRRAGGGGDRRAAAWLPLDPTGAEATVAATSGVYDELTGHTITGEFYDWYEDHEGAFYLGSPLSEPLSERGQEVQYFERGLLLDGKRGTWLAPLPREMTWDRRLDIETAPVAQDDLPTFAETLFVTTPNPAPVNDEDATGRKRIEISIPDQTIRAYQGHNLVMESLISTGIEPNDTETGVFHVRIKRELEDMSGFTDSTGEVIALDDQPEEDDFVGNLEEYDVEDVPHVLYFNQEAEALHGAYWHNNFGTPMSHGCVNLPLDVAAFIFEWAPLGTEVWVHE